MLSEDQLRAMSAEEFSQLDYLVAYESERRRILRSAKNDLGKLLGSYVDAGGDIKDLFTHSNPVQQEAEVIIEEDDNV